MPKVNPLIRAYQNYQLKTVKGTLQQNLRAAKKKGDRHLIDEASMNLAGFYEASENLADLATLLKELADDDKASGACPVGNLGRLAFTYERLGQMDKAEECLNEILDIQRKKPVKPAQLLHDINNVAQVYVRQKKYAQAEALYQECLDISGKEGHDPNTTGGVLANMAKLYQDWGKYEKAADFLMQERDLVEKFLGAGNIMITRPMARLAQLYTVQEKHADALETHELILRLLEREGAHDLRFKLTTLEGIAAAATKLGDTAKAEATKAKVAEVVQNEAQTEIQRVAQLLFTGAADNYKSRNEDDIQRDLDVVRLNISHLKTAEVPDCKVHTSVIMNFIQRLTNKRAFDEAAAMYALLLEALQARSDLPPEVVFLPLMNASFLAIKNEKWDAAKVHYQKAFELAEKHLPTIQLAQAMYDIGHLLIANEATKEQGIKLYDRAAVNITTLHDQGKLITPTEDVKKISTGAVFGGYALTGRSAIAFMLRKMASDFEKMDNTRASALNLLNLAIDLLEADRKQDETRALASLEKSITLRSKAGVYVKMQDRDLAAEMMEEASDTLAQITETELASVVHEHTIRTLVELSDLQDDVQKRRQTADKAAALAKQHFGTKSLLYADALHALARLQISTEDWVGAETALTEVTKIEEAMLFPFDQRRQNTIRDLKTVYEKQGLTEKAQQLEASMEGNAFPLHAFFVL
eukprot:NODE_564_length_2316_cov_69.582763_g536_i0.p1 GENE.NODE_564_length_2316_cov_69.582763_g536_i0~~NODE_564_length_2316_cov_69.582763_g536_i0.p1  ORF type:complete len:698 (-),score=206.04 NODE_564_length_2316_cov_69.582763_g536_i0:141-2234(-)